MSWQSIIGHEPQLRVLKTALGAKRLAHAYLFAGPEGSGKETVAFELAKILNCRSFRDLPGEGSCGECESCRQADRLMHPNIEYLFPVEAALLETIDPSKKENKKLTEARERYEALLGEKRRNPFFTPAMERSMGILTEQVVMLQHKASLAPRDGGKKVFIISQAERLHPTAANKLLKLLEEPPAHVVFVLVSSRPESVLPTIRSRCQLLNFARPRPAEIEAWIAKRAPQLDETGRRFIVSLSRGNLSSALELIEAETGDGAAPAVVGIRNKAIDYLRNVLVPAKFHEAIGACEELSKSSTRTEQLIFLDALLLFFQDVTRRAIDPAFPELNNPDIAENTNRFVKAFPNRDLYQASTAIEEAMRAINRNASVILVLAGLTAELRGILQAK
ncbi:DNA polymerase III subunit [Chlorobaculum sp. 24CR]|uniref:DNA polymerase III subunit n=1 Tax=Chlorobaculum sp. 24CR TaxID=2508878 RepID=UPI00100A960B|nr:DNA polymerase III subunit [Chlorobaculum sp. 24CR]RXK89095.1 DNA polymerase III subunit [Chlorobaculum sp. 24CR]